LSTESTRGIRLNKYISNAGICSRRKADEYIKEGLVKVDGEVVLEMGYRVQEGQKVTFRDKSVDPETKVYVLLNKPKDYITTTKDEHGRKTVLDLVESAADVRLYPVGRLDRYTTGLLIMTNDGELTQKLSHPSFEVKKIYHAFLDKPFDAKDLKSLRDGIELEDGLVKPDQVEFASDDNLEVGIELHSGKNRIVRRMFEHFGYKVQKLDRVLYAGLTKKNLPRGRWRYLSDKEVARLMQLS
jgi:23S rRNA pseudouridine2605 synthase